MGKKLVKITADYIIDEYLAAKKLKGTQKTKAMSRVKHLSKHLNHFIQPDSVA